MSGKPSMNPALLKRLQAQRTPRGAQPKGTIEQQVLDLLGRFGKDMNKATQSALTLMWINRDQLSDGGPLQQLATPLVERWTLMMSTPTFHDRLEHYAALFDCKELLHQREKETYENANKHGRDTLYWLVKNAASAEEAHTETAKIRRLVRGALFYIVGDLVHMKMDAGDPAAILRRWFVDAGLGPLFDEGQRVDDPDPELVRRLLKPEGSIEYLGRRLPEITETMLGEFGVELAARYLPDVCSTIDKFLEPGNALPRVTKSALRSFRSSVAERASTL